MRDEKSKEEEIGDAKLDYARGVAKLVAVVNDLARYWPDDPAGQELIHGEIAAARNHLQAIAQSAEFLSLVVEHPSLTKED